MTLRNDWNNMHPRKRGTAIVLTIGGLLILGTAIGAANGPATVSAPVAQTEPEKVQQAVYQQHSCRPQLQYMERVGSDNTGTGYMVGCGTWFYFALIRPSGTIEVNEVRVKWNGR